MEGVKCILLDIEGTVCSISFVKDVLFPSAIKALPGVLAGKWDAPDFQPYRNAFPEQYRDDADALQAHVEDLTERDVKVAYLKNLQGFLWEEGYKSGAYATSLFPDVVPALQQWKRSGYSLAIYSSGSVFAQKLLFGHVQTAETPTSKKRGRPTEGSENQAKDGTAEPLPKKLVTHSGEATESAIVRDNENADGRHDKFNGEKLGTPISAGGELAKHAVDQAGNVGAPKPDGDVKASNVHDLTDMFDAWFDTTNAGLKTVAGSYTKIAEQLKHRPKEILFLSDNVKEVDAAIEAGMKSIVVDRPGNAPLPSDTKERLHVVEALDQISL